MTKPGGENWKTVQFLLLPVEPRITFEYDDSTVEAVGMLVQESATRTRVVYGYFDPDLLEIVPVEPGAKAQGPPTRKGKVQKAVYPTDYRE